MWLRCQTIWKKMHCFWQNYASKVTGRIPVHVVLFELFSRWFCFALPETQPPYNLEVHLVLERYAQTAVRKEITMRIDVICFRDNFLDWKKRGNRKKSASPKNFAGCGSSLIRVTVISRQKRKEIKGRSRGIEKASIPAWTANNCRSSS